jgi:uncharacterized protein YaaW (UPF0174 family)
MYEGIEAVRTGDLYALLEICSSQDLEPLVTAILGNPSNLLNTSVLYERYRPDHRKYSEKIGDEIRLAAGASAMNLFRRGERHSYAEIVVEVCKKLGVPCQPAEILANEANLLDLFLRRRWDSAGAEERKRLAEEARQTALSKISDSAALAKAGAKFVMNRLALGSAVKGALENAVLDTAFEVTVPCVLHIAYLRRRILGESQEIAGATAAGKAALTKDSVPALQSAALALVAEDGEPVLSLARIPEPGEGGAWHEVSPSDNGISRLSPLLQAVPSLAAAVEFARTNYMIVVTNGDKFLTAKDGTTKAVTVGADGKFSGIANLFGSDGLATMLDVSAVMNVASFVLAQKHLADISRKLSEIKSGIDGIRKFQKDERRSVVTGSIRYFEQVAAPVLGGELSERVLHQIERHEADLIKVQDHVMTDLRTEIDAVMKLKDDEWFGSADMKRAIEERQTAIGDLYRELILCIRARCCGWQLLCAFPGDDKGKEVRRRDIVKSIDELETGGQMLAKTDDHLRNRIHELSSFWNKATTVNERKLALLRANEALLADVTDSRATVMADLLAADEMLAAMKRPVSMALRIEDGKIAAIRAL